MHSVPARTYVMVLLRRRERETAMMVGEWEGVGFWEKARCQSRGVSQGRMASCLRMDVFTPPPDNVRIRTSDRLSSVGRPCAPAIRVERRVYLFVLVPTIALQRGLVTFTPSSTSPGVLIHSPADAAELSPGAMWLS